MAGVIEGLKYAPTSIHKKEIYKYYRKEFESDVKESTNYHDYCMILNDFTMQIVNDIIYNGAVFYLPYGLGTMHIIKTIREPKFINNGTKLKLNHLPVNYVATKKMWEERPETKVAKKFIYHMNEHTDNRCFKIKWNKSTCRVTNSEKYLFKAVRAFSRKLAKHLMNPESQLNYQENVKRKIR